MVRKMKRARRLSSSFLSSWEEEAGEYEFERWRTAHLSAAGTGELQHPPDTQTPKLQASTYEPLDEEAVGLSWLLLLRDGSSLLLLLLLLSALSFNRHTASLELCSLTPSSKEKREKKQNLERKNSGELALLLVDDSSPAGLAERNLVIHQSLKKCVECCAVLRQLTAACVWE